MERETGSYKAHVFVCTNKKANKSCCADSGGVELRDTLKAWAKQEGLHERVRINASGCLDRCEAGIAIAIYPHNEWWTHVRGTDLEDLKNRIRDLAK